MRKSLPENEEIDEWLEDPKFLSRVLKLASKKTSKYPDYNNLLKNIKWMLPHMWSFYSWDYSYVANLFISALEELGKGIDSDWHLVDRKRSVQCKFAARKLKKALAANYFLDDKSHINWRKRQTNYDFACREGTKLKHIYLYDNAMGMARGEYADKMWHLMHERLAKTEEVSYNEAWKYIAKHFRGWWT